MSNTINKTIFTIGHSNQSFDDFIKKLSNHSITTLVDVRSKPYSRWVPHFNQKRLLVSLDEHGITYLFRGANLGGLAENKNYSEAVNELADLVISGSSVVVMCSEKDYQKCHRHTKLTPDFEAVGLHVKHIF